MRKRYESLTTRLVSGPIPLAMGLRRAWSAGYTWHHLQTDVLAGLVVGMIALPLSMALAIASGVAPQYGLYTAMVSGVIAAFLGGSRVNVTGPTAAFVVILAPISAQYGLAGLLLATLMAGVIQIIMGAARMGRLIQFIPHPVTTGFTAGIAVVIATLQLKDFLGLNITTMPSEFLGKVATLAQHLPTLTWADAAVGVGTLAMLVGWSKWTQKIPAPLVALTLAALVAWGAGLDVATLGSQFSYRDAAGVMQPGIPRMPPMPAWPWRMEGPSGQPLTLSFELLRHLIGPATAIALLGAIESLLCSVVADGLSDTKHDPDGELIGQGLANVVGPWFGGFAATAAIARTAANVRAGGRSPVAAIVHCLFVLVAMLAMAPLLSYLPMAAMAALLILVAWNMSDARHFGHILKVAPRSDVAVLLTCFGLTVVFDMVIAISVGVVLASFLFMSRMAAISDTKLAQGLHSQLLAPLPPGVCLYEIAGPLFFGAAEKAADALSHVADHVDVVILEMAGVSVMDATGLVALESAIQKLQSAGAMVVLSGVVGQPADLLRRSGITPSSTRLAICGSLQEAEMLVRLVNHSRSADSD